jgi:hypothetical protein
MGTTKLIVAYPGPKDVDAFEAVYQKEHVPMAIANLPGKTKIVATTVLQSPQRQSAVLPHCRGLLSFHGSPPALRGLSWRAANVGSRCEISSGGPSVIMRAEEDAFNF